MHRTYEPTDKTRFHRRPQRGSYDQTTIFQILDSAVIAHIAYVLDGAPFVTPTAFWRGGDWLYWHGSAASRMTQAQAEGLPVCVTVTHIDGLVLGRSGFTHSLNYRSVMAFGRTQLVAGMEEKRRAMDTFISRLYPGRPNEMRASHAAELDAIAVIAMPIDEATAKVRADGVLEKPEDRGAVTWAGVIPLMLTIGKVQPDPAFAPGTPLPASVAHYTEGARLDDVLARQAPPEAET